jgi:hypothetical protein
LFAEVMEILSIKNEELRIKNEWIILHS